VRTAPGEEDLRALLKDVGNGLNFIKTTVRDKEMDTDFIHVPSEMRIASDKELIEFCFPPEVLRAPLLRKSPSWLDLS
jgi:hypothetical protein